MRCCVFFYLPPEQAGLNIVVFTFLNQEAVQVVGAGVWDGCPYKTLMLM